MELRPALAQRLVERVAASVDCGVSVTDPRGLVLASTGSAHVHTYIPPPVHDASSHVAVEREDDLRQRSQLLLTYADQVVGTLVLENISQRDQNAAQMSKTLAEMIIYQKVVIEQLPHQTRLCDTFVADLLHGRHKDAETVHEEAALLGIDLALPRGGGSDR